MKEPASSHPQVSAWLAHIRSLAVDIGPRPPTREGERRGAEYASQELQKLGLQPVCETFRSARSVFTPHLAASIAMLLAFFIYPLGGWLTQGLAALISIVSLVSQLLELGFHDNLYRWLIPKGQSQNVFAAIPPAEEYRGDLILVGHLDTQHTPLIFKSHQWVEAYGYFTTVVFITFLAQALLFPLGFLPGWGWVWYAAIPSALCAILLAAMLIQGEASPFTAGANDNASAVGMVLTLASEIAKRPLKHLRVYAVCTGCEEAQHYGMIDFYQRHRSELKAPKSVVFELVGCSGPAWLTKEGIVVPFHADPQLLQEIELLAAAHPEWEAYPVSVNGGNTEMAEGIRFKVPAITIFGMTRDGVSPYWHQPQDTFDKMNPVVMEKTWELTWAFVTRLDEIA